MKRWAIIGFSFAIVVAVFGFSGWWYAQREAAKEVQRAMIDADLVGRVTYASVSYKPLTSTIIIHDIRPVSDELPSSLRVESLEILDWAPENDVLTRAHIIIINCWMNVLEAARSEFEKNPKVLAVSFRDPPSKLFTHPWQTLLVLGYQELIFNAELDYRYDPADATARLTFSLNGDQLGEKRLHLTLAGVKPKLIQKLSLIQSGIPTEDPLAAMLALGALSNLKRDAEQISLAEFSLSYQDSGLIRRLKQFLDVQTLRLPHEPSQVELSDDAVKKVVTLGVGLGLSEEKIRSGAQAFANFSRNPDRLQLHTRIDQPIRLSRFAAIDGDREGTSGFAPLRNLVLLTNLEITN